MAAPPPPSDEELSVIREFFNSSAAKNLFEHLEHRSIMAWLNTIDTATRERIWTDHQAMLRLIIAMRDSDGLRRQELRSQPPNYGV